MLVTVCILVGVLLGSAAMLAIIMALLARVIPLTIDKALKEVRERLAEVTAEE